MASIALLVALAPCAADALVTAAGADTGSDCSAAFSTAPSVALSYTTIPPERYARIGHLTMT